MEIELLYCLTKQYKKEVVKYILHNIEIWCQRIRALGTG